MDKPNSENFKAAFRVLESELNDAKEELNKKYAQCFLAEIRKTLAPFNTKRHVIVIHAGMDRCNIRVDNEGIEYLPDHHCRGLYVLLQEISDSLHWPWCAYLHGQRLNEPCPPRNI